MRSKRNGLEPEVLIIQLEAAVDDGCKICREAAKNPLIKPCGWCGWIYQEFEEARPIQKTNDGGGVKNDKR
tara:strand:- start:645 stop:857 length:213 start_codon:yes stop_codon:yes gene_type:complete